MDTSLKITDFYIGDAISFRSWATNSSVVGRIEAIYGDWLRVRRNDTGEYQAVHYTRAHLQSTERGSVRDLIDCGLLPRMSFNEAAPPRSPIWKQFIPAIEQGRERLAEIKRKQEHIHDIACVCYCTYNTTCRWCRIVEKLEDEIKELKDMIKNNN